MDLLPDTNDLNSELLSSSNKAEIPRISKKRDTSSISKKTESFDLKSIGKFSLIGKKKILKKKVKKSKLLDSGNCLKSSEKKNNFLNNLEILNFSQDKKRPKSVINGSMINTIDIVNIQENIKRHSNPSIIDKIIKKSLKKAKIKKIKQEKVNKLNEMLTEIKKNEIEYQNKQIRLQNSIKLHNKRKKTPKNKFSPEINNIYTLKTDTSNKIKKNDFSVLDSGIKTNKRSVSVSDHYRKKKNELKKYVKKKKNEQQDKLKEIADKTVKLKEMENLKEYVRKFHSKSSDNSLSSIESFEKIKLDEQTDVNRNISFIDDKFSERSLEKESSLYKVNQLYLNNKFSPIFNNTDDEKYFDHINMKPKEMHEFFRTEHLENIQVIPQSKENLMTFENLSSISIVNKKVKNELSISQTSSIPIESAPKSKNFSIMPYSSISLVPSRNQEKKLEKVTFPILYCAAVKSTKDLTLKLNNQFSWSYAQIFLIEQLKNFEVLNLKEISEYVPSDITEKIESNMQKRYSSIIDYLNEEAILTSSDLLESMSLEEHKAFIQSIQLKKQCLYEILLDSAENSQFSAEKQKNNSIEEKQREQDESESSEDDTVLGISHSRSLKSLHEDLSVKSKKASEGPQKPLDSFLFFGFEDDSSAEFFENPENSPTISGITRNLPLPAFEISEFPQMFSFKSSEAIQALVAKVFQLLNPNEVLLNLSQAIPRDPLKELARIEEIQIGEFVDDFRYDYINVFDSEAVLNVIEKDLVHKYKSTELVNAEKIHTKMILDLINYLFQQFRKCGYKGSSFPWNRRVERNAKNVRFEEIREKVLHDFAKISKCELGNLKVGMLGEENESTFLSIFKEKQIENILFDEAASEEERWTDYTWEETQVKLDLADIVIYDLVEEVIFKLNNQI